MLLDVFLAVWCTSAGEQSDHWLVTNNRVRLLAAGGLTDRRARSLLEEGLRLRRIDAMGRQ
jgi:hypothetical protein